MKADLEALESVVLDGHGGSLLDEPAASNKVRAFIRSVPNYLVCFEKIFFTYLWIKKKESGKINLNLIETNRKNSRSSSWRQPWDFGIFVEKKKIGYQQRSQWTWSSSQGIKLM